LGLFLFCNTFTPFLSNGHRPSAGTFTGMKTPLRLSEALALMDLSVTTGQLRPFDLVFCTADPKRDTGGERVHFPRAVLTTARHRPGTSVGTPTPRALVAQRLPIKVKNLISGQIRHVRIELIESINGHPVL
jgi:hypothetical protein